MERMALKLRSFGGSPPALGKTEVTNHLGLSRRSRQTPKSAVAIAEVPRIILSGSLELNIGPNFDWSSQDRTPRFVSRGI